MCDTWSIADCLTSQKQFSFFGVKEYRFENYLALVSMSSNIHFYASGVGGARSD